MEGHHPNDCELFGVPLPPSVDYLLRKIRAAHGGLPPVDAEARRKLADRGELGSLEILRKVESTTKPIANLSGYIVRMLKMYPPSSPSKRRVISDGCAGIPSPNRSPSCSPVLMRAVPYYFGSKMTEPAIGRCSTFVDVPSTSEVEAGRADKEALGAMEFRKQFLILNYIGGNELHNVTNAEEIKWLSTLSMVQFEAIVWERFGRNNVSAEDRSMYYNWDTKKTYLYDCHVSTNGKIRFKGPFLNKSRTHLQKVLGDDNILRVKFAEDANNLGINSLDHSYHEYRRLAVEDGIAVGLRRYFFFVFKDGGNEDKKKNPKSSSVKCYFIRLHSDALIDKYGDYILKNRTMCQARSLFMHGHTLPNAANYMARFSLILSKTYSLGADLTSVTMKIEDDVCCLDGCGNPIYRDGKPLIHSDGTGEISEDLALMCPKNILEGNCTNDKDMEDISNLDEHVDGIAEAERLRTEMQEPPMLIQCRLFNKGHAIKGTFLVNKKLPPKTIKVRNSMVKVMQDEEFPNYFLGTKKQNSLEIVGTSKRPKRTHLSRNLIALLVHGGVPYSFFMDLLEDALRETDGAFTNTNSAIKVAINAGKSEDFMIVKLIACGIPLEEPYLQHRLTLLLKEQKTSLREARIYISDSYYLMGTVDPTGELKSDEVCIVLDNGQVSGKVIVYRYPGIHFGDVRVLKATYVKELESVVGNAKYAIFFSRKGPRSAADEMAGGDFDGDMYWVSRHPMLLNHFKPSEPWNPSPTCKAKEESRKVDQFSDKEFEDELFKRFVTLRFQPSFAMGEAADSCKALMDRFLTLKDDCVDEKNRLKDNIIKLNDIYSIALDAPKKGLKVEVPKELKAKSFPHYMENKKNTYHSNSILAQIFDRVVAYQTDNNSGKDIWKLQQFEVGNIPQSCSIKWEAYYDEYRKEMSQAMSIQDRDLMNEAAGGVKRKYKELLYGAEELESRTRNLGEIFNEALAIYHVCYDHAIANRNDSLCSFAWNIAGSALFQYFIGKVGGPLIYCTPSAIREMLTRKKNG